MKTYRISQLGRLSGLSRSTLLYYDRIGLLRASGRTPSGYRTYTRQDVQQLNRICHFRQAGLALAEIRLLLSARGRPHAAVLEKRLQQAGDQIVALRNQQRLLASMLKGITRQNGPATVNKDMWVEMLRAAGVSESSMNRWHAEFERRSPQGHHEFLTSLGLSEPDIRRIRSWSKRTAP